MLERIVGPLKIIEQREIARTPEQVWPLVAKWAQSLGLTLVEREGISAVYEEQRGAAAQVRHVLYRMIGQPRIGGTGSIRFTVVPREHDHSNPAHSADADATDADLPNGSYSGVTLTVTVDVSAQRETTSWTGGGIIVGGSAASVYLASASSLWLLGIPLAGFIGASYFMDRKRALVHITEPLQTITDELAAGRVPPRQRDLLKQRLKAIGRS